MIVLISDILLQSLSSEILTQIIQNKAIKTRNLYKSKSWHWNLQVSNTQIFKILLWNLKKEKIKFLNKVISRLCSWNNFSFQKNSWMKKIKLWCKIIHNTDSTELREFWEVVLRKIRTWAPRTSNIMKTMLAAVSIQIQESCQTRRNKKEKTQRKLSVKICKISLRKQLFNLNIPIKLNQASLTCSKIFIVINDDLYEYILSFNL